MLATVPIRYHFSREDLKQLGAAEGEPSGMKLSLFAALPKTGRDVRRGPVILKDLRVEAEAELLARRIPRPEVSEILAPLDDIMANSEFSWPQGGTLAIFSSSSGSSTFLLPIETASRMEIDARFRVDPLLPLLFEDGRFHLLSLNLKSVRLWEVSRENLVEIPLEGIPTNLRAAENFEDTESYLAFHTGTVSPGRGIRPALYHGQGGGKGDVKEMKRDILEFFHQLDRGLKARLDGSLQPLMLAGTGTLRALFREASTHTRIFPEAVDGNVESVPKRDLHAKAWELFGLGFLHERKEALRRFREQIATGRTAAGVTDVVPMASQGRIAVLFVKDGYRCPGTFDRGSGKVEPAGGPGQGSQDLVNLACLHTILGDGKVYVLPPEEMPEACDIAALARY
jgi:hypothetical protein